jgi:glycosyltransferase involved in cell wall biosynthesis
MKVLLLDQFSELGGGQRMLLETLTALRERDWSGLLGLPGDGEIVRRATALGFPVERIDCGPFASGAKSFADLLRFLPGLPLLAGQIRSLAGRANPDLVYVNGPRLLPAVALAGLRPPVLFHSHTALSGPVRQLVGLSLRRMNAHVAAVCRMVADCWRPFVSDARVSVIHNGVAGPHRISPRSTATLGPPRIGCIGRIIREKGQREFLAAAALIHRALPDARFIVYGAPLFSDPAALRYEQEVRAEAAGLPVEFAGWTHDVYAALEELDVLLVPSVWPEPNALVILEAFAAGVPVIAFRVGGIPEFLEDGRTGLLCEDPAEMARLTVDLLRDRQRLTAIADEGREEWHTRFTAQRYRTQIAETMEKLARGCPEPVKRSSARERSVVSKINIPK